MAWGSEKSYCAKDGKGIADAGDDTNEVVLRDLKHYRKTGHHLDMHGRRRVMHETFGCFVATAVYGSYDCPEVVVLRQFRDCTLRKFWAGRTFIKLYYRYGPYLAMVVKRSPLLTCIFKTGLDQFIHRYKKSTGR